MEPDISVRAYDSGVNGEIRCDVTLFRHHIILTQREAFTLIDCLRGALLSVPGSHKRDRQEVSDEEIIAAVTEEMKDG